MQGKKIRPEYPLGSKYLESGPASEYFIQKMRHFFLRVHSSRISNGICFRFCRKFIRHKPTLSTQECADPKRSRRKWEGSSLPNALNFCNLLSLSSVVLFWYTRYDFYFTKWHTKFRRGGTLLRRKKPQHSTNIRTLGQNLVAVLGLDMNKNLNCKCPQTFCYSKRRNCWDPLLQKITNANNSYLSHYLLSGFPSNNFRKTLGLLKSILRAIAEDMAHTAQLLACLLLAMTKHGI